MLRVKLRISQTSQKKMEIFWPWMFFYFFTTFFIYYFWFTRKNCYSLLFSALFCCGCFFGAFFIIIFCIIVQISTRKKLKLTHKNVFRVKKEIWEQKDFKTQYLENCTWINDLIRFVQDLFKFFFLVVNSSWSIF